MKRYTAFLLALMLPAFEVGLNGRILEQFSDAADQGAAECVSCVIR